MIKRTRFLAGVLTALLLQMLAIPAFADDWANVIMYHRFGEDKYPSTSISLEKFQTHVQEFKDPKYNIIPLEDIVDRLQAGAPLPDRTVAITVDDAYLSVYEEAWPILREAGIPFTVFASTDHLNSQGGGYMNWAQIKEMADAGVTIGHHTASHAHLPALTREQVISEIERANQEFETKLGFVPKLFAYPYGEYGTEIQNIVREFGFIAAFGQQSGVVYKGHDKYAYPRFAMSENYGNIGRLRLAMNALPLRVRNVAPSDKILQKNPPAFGFSLAEKYENISQLRCYSSNQSGGAVPIQMIGDERVEIRLSQAYSPGRGRINCTLPGPNGRFRWFGNLFYIPRK
ncbi:polysaccharide deacetylase family protein [Sneathiella limimaris]|uniref:polysaccharide deacetylase family protein n=1 Tax=Sneathiella limimaris TaxID=1964213 RepID=UPI00146C9521|nr:polysaccharide deacetylase family protein [Sneathiella limimaris]